MATGTDEPTSEQAANLILVEKAAADSGERGTTAVMRMKYRYAQSEGERRGPALTSPIWRAWNPESPAELNATADRRTAADNPALTSPVRTVRRA